MANQEPSTLLCNENNGLCFDNLELDDDDNISIYYDQINHNHSWSYVFKSEPLIQSPTQTHDLFASFLHKEKCFLPRKDYFNRLQFGDLDLISRNEVIDWIFKVHSYYNFGPLSLYLAVNYLDRFLSTSDLPVTRDKSWVVQLLAVACLSIATKMDETIVPLLIEFQMGDPKYVFEAKTIQRMELLVLDTLKWKMNVVTPFSYVEYFVKKLCDTHCVNFQSYTTSRVMNRAIQLILWTIRGIDFLEFKSSEIAAAVAMFVSAEILAVDDIDKDKAISCFIHLDMEKVIKGVEMIKSMSLPRMNRDYNVGISHSPIAVLESTCFSYKSEELKIVGSIFTSTNTSTSSIISCNPEAKRRKLNLDTIK